MAKRKYSDETKAAAMAALLEGQAVTYVAKEYKIPQTTVQTWKKLIIDGKITSDTLQKKEIGTLLLEYLETNIEALQVQASFTKKEDWLNKQSAESLAVLHGVMMDKTIRLLEAMSKVSNATNSRDTND